MQSVVGGTALMLLSLTQFASIITRETRRPIHQKPLTPTPLIMDMEAVLEVALRAVPSNKKGGNETHKWVTVDMASRTQCPPT